MLESFAIPASVCIAVIERSVLIGREWLLSKRHQAATYQSYPSALMWLALNGISTPAIQLIVQIKLVCLLKCQAMCAFLHRLGKNSRIDEHISFAWISVKQGKNYTSYDAMHSGARADKSCKNEVLKIVCKYFLRWLNDVSPKWIMIGIVLNFWSHLMWGEVWKYWLLKFHQSTVSTSL